MGQSARVSEGRSHAVTAITVRILRPLVRILLRFGVPYHACAATLKWVYVDTAYRHFSIDGRRPTQSRVSVITGLSRVEIRKQEAADMSATPPSARRWHRAGRVLSAWAEDTQYQDADGKPLILRLEGSAPSFVSLVEKYSGGATYRSILDELVGADAITFDQRQQTVELLRPYYLTEANDDEFQTLDVLGFSAGHLISTYEKNTRPGRDEPFIQRLVIQERVPVSLVDQARRYVRKRSQELANEVDIYLTGLVTLYDGDDEEFIDQLGLGLYYFETEEGEGGLDS